MVQSWEMSSKDTNNLTEYFIELLSSWNFSQWLTTYTQSEWNVNISMVSAGKQHYSITSWYSRENAKFNSNTFLWAGIGLKSLKWTHLCIMQQLNKSACGEKSCGEKCTRQVRAENTWYSISNQDFDQIAPYFQGIRNLCMSIQSLGRALAKRTCKVAISGSTCMRD